MLKGIASSCVMGFLRLKAYLKEHPRLADLVALAGGIVYILGLIWFGITQRSVLDEGLYQFKGLIFASGRYVPFQDYGPWTNQMPFSYLIPGTVQLLFGPGLRTARLLAFIFAVLMLVALWLTARRLGNAWLAAAVVWAFAINPATSRYYSMAASQGLVACLLMWTMFFTLGKDRKLWQLLLGIFLTCVMIFVRINMLPVLPVLILYILWEHGWKKALSALFTGGFFFVLFHAMYWPGILRMWAYWLPESLVPFLKPWQLPAAARSIWDPVVTFDQRLESFFQLMRTHFITMTGVIAAWLFFPRRKDWKSPSDLKIAVFLSVLFIMLVGLHVWAALGNNYCTYCFSGYNAFFIGLAALLVVVSISLWQPNPPTWRKVAAFIVLLILFAGISLSASDFIGPVVSDKTNFQLMRALLQIPVPRFKNHQFQPGTIPLQQLIANLTQFDYYKIPEYAMTYFPLIAGAVAGVIFLFVVAIAKYSFKSAQVIKSMALVFFTFMIFWAVGSLLLPTNLLANSYKAYDCNSNIITATEQAGEYLAETIPAGAQIYWKGYSPVSLLYIPDVNIYPSQLNISYSFSIGGDPDELERYGWWNETLSDKWLAEADYVLIEQNDFVRGGKIPELLATSGKYEELPPAPSTAPCSDLYFIRIFRRLP